MTVALGTNIANPISTALSQWLGFDTMGKLSNYGKLGVTDPDAVIKALFANSEQGAWYDPSDLSTMFKDRAGTIQVTADGQTVGKILDKSGRGNHATAPNDAARPLYKTSGGLHWLQFDGVDDSLKSTSTLNITGAACLFTGASAGASASATVTYELATTNRSDSRILSTTDSTGRTEVISGAGWSNILAYKDSVTPTAKTVWASYGPNPFVIRENGVQKATIGGTGWPVQPLEVVSMGGATDNMSCNAANIYSVIALGRLATTQELTDTETWVNGKTGAWA